MYYFTKKKYLPHKMFTYAGKIVICLSLHNIGMKYRV